MNQLSSKSVRLASQKKSNRIIPLLKSKFNEKNKLSHSTNQTSKKELSTTPHRQLGVHRYNWSKNYFPGEVSLISYNVLSQNHLEKHNNLYNGVADECLQWEYRKNKLAEQLANFITKDKVSIFCLQEVDADKLEEFYRPFFEKHGFEIIYHKRPLCYRGNNSYDNPTCYPDGSAIVFKSSKFEPIATEKLDFLKEFNKFNVKQAVQDVESSRYTNSMPLDLNYSTVAILQKLQSKENDRQFVVGTTHLAFDPRKGDLKLAQLLLLFYRIRKFANASQRSKSQRTVLPIIMTGDFNIHATSDIFNNFIIKGEIDCSKTINALLSGQLNFHQSKFKSAVPSLITCHKHFYRRLYDDLPECKFIESNQISSASKSIIKSPLKLQNMKMPYVDLYKRNRNDLNKQPVSTIMNASVKMKEEVIRFLCVDHAIVSDEIPIYNRLKLPLKGEIERDWSNSKQILGYVNPSDHMPIGINFDIPAI